MTLMKKKAESIAEELTDVIIDRINDEAYIRHLAAIVESSDDAIISKSLDGIITSWNRGSERMFGYSAAQAVGKHISLIIPPEYINEEKNILEKIRNNEIIDQFETVRNRQHGEKFYVSLTVSPLKDRMGNIIGVSKIARDISARRNAEVQHSKDNKELIFQNEEKGKRADELIIANKELAFQDGEKAKRADELMIANKELAFQNKEKEKRAAELIIANRELAFQNQEKEERAAELIIANKELGFQNEKKEKRAAELSIANTELAYQNKEKEKRAAELIIANAELIFQNEEKEERAAELSTANKELAFQNTEKEKRANELIVANKELAFQNKEKEKRAGELKIANIELVFQNKEKEKRAAELSTANKELAFQNEEKEKRAAELIVANKELAFQNKEKEKLAGELNIANIELAFQNEEKEKRAAELSIANKELALQNKEKIERTAQLESANKELESFSYSVSHDLRAPLRAVQGYARMLKEIQENQAGPEAIRMMNNIINNAKKMGQLIDDLLTFSRLGRKELTKIFIPMTDLVTTICEELKSETESRDIDIRIESLAPAKADNITIKQVWLNLISNAIKYSRLKSKAIIEISSEIKGNEIIYAIKDNGAGFDMRYSGKLFGVFQRLHSDEEFEGTGVGLAIVQRIIHKHGGRVWAESKINEGSTFFFTLNKS
ncbi:MAG: Phytochrome-like protein cph1 [Bacteroidetes bacterium]|jgi:PAS domain S-box-containing protein|nr:Phytochrome-like protein cph1 [Bacteroidota bacterium]